jgi:hypothetical protein
MNTISIVMGDWRRDGRTASLTQYISTNLSETEVERAYQEGCSIVGIDLCSVFDEKRKADESEIQKFEVAGLEDFLKSEYGLDFPFGGKTNVEVFFNNFETEDVFKLFCFLVKKGNPDFKHSVVNDEIKKIWIDCHSFFQ